MMMMMRIMVIMVLMVVIMLTTTTTKTTMMMTRRRRRMRTMMMMMGADGAWWDFRLQERHRRGCVHQDTFQSIPALKNICEFKNGIILTKDFVNNNIIMHKNQCVEYFVQFDSSCCIIWPSTFFKCTQLILWTKSHSLYLSKLFHRILFIFFLK